MEKYSPSHDEQAQKIHDDLMLIGEVAVGFMKVPRLTMIEDGRHENDAEHSYHLGLSAIEVAASYYPELDTGLVAQFAYVHDLPELRPGDTPSYDLSDEERAAKEAQEKDEVEWLVSYLPPHLSQLLSRYEEQQEPEARFVRLVDKLMPAVNHAVVPEANNKVFLEYYDIKTIHELKARSAKRSEMLQEMFPEFDLLLLTRQLTSATATERIFSVNDSSGS